MKDSYFVSLGEGKYEFVATAEKAAELCNEALAVYRTDAARYGWHEDAENICWGVVVAKAECEYTVDREETYCDYRMVDLPEGEAT